MQRPEDLDEIGRSSVASRAVGTSTEHAQSSRSHAILRLEVVNTAVVTARAALNAAKSLRPARKNALDNLTNVACTANCNINAKCFWNFILIMQEEWRTAPENDDLY